MPLIDSKHDSQRTQVLLIGMLDSIHVARWLRQFANEKIDFMIFPSKKFKKLHPALKLLITSKNVATFSLRPKSIFLDLAGYKDFILNVFPEKFGIYGIRNIFLEQIVRDSSIDFIHALEIQGAGYLVNALPKSYREKSRFILTNWGSDIYFYKNIPSHRKILEDLLPKADFYSAECFRDYRLATEFGFKGIELPCIPNAGGFDLENEVSSQLKTSQRNQVIIKGYGGLFGKVELALDVLEEISERFPEIKYYIYSVTEDVERRIKELPSKLQDKIRYSTQKKKVSHESLLGEFKASRVYIGCSLSDGISTSFLESLLSGTYPIQTNTSCANEWIEKGTFGTIVDLNSREICQAVHEALLDDLKVDQAADANLIVAKRYLSESGVKSQALKFYRKPLL